MDEKGTTADRTTPVLIADDHTLFRYGMKAMLDAAAGYKVVGEAATGEEAVAMAADLEPDIVLMDLQMSRMNGIEATRRIVAGSPHVGVVEPESSSRRTGTGPVAVALHSQPFTNKPLIGA